jgi:hypothetical protein
VSASRGTCSHCGEPMRGLAGLTVEGVHYRLCHPDEGMDCYRLVTVYRHPAKDCPCAGGSLPEEVSRTPENGYLGTMTLDAAIAAVAAAISTTTGDK